MMRIGSIRLAQGVTRRHALAAVYASLTTLSLLVYINLIQPYLLINILELPASEIGSVTGRLGAVHEGVAIVTMCLIGGLSNPGAWTHDTVPLIQPVTNHPGKRKS